MRAAPLTLVVLLAFAAAIAAASAEASDWPPCDVPEPLLFAQLDTALENMEFDGNGSLFLTAFDEGLYRATPDGAVHHVARSDREPAPTEAEPFLVSTAFMGVALGTDGALYVAEGHAVGPPVPARVLRFPVPGEPSFEVLAEGFPNANGLAADAEGHLYLAHGFRDELWRIAPDGTWSVWTRVPDAVNGVVAHPDGDRLVIAPVADPSNTVLAIPFTDPDAREVLFRFNAPPSAHGDPAPDAERPPVAEGIDDLAVAPDGRVLISAHLQNRFLMGDPATGVACVLVDETRAEPSSIRVAAGFGEWDGWAFTTDFSGDVWAVDIRPQDEQGNGEDASTDEGTPDVSRATPGLAPVLVLMTAAVVSITARR